jgi:hypothetical protein
MKTTLPSDLSRNPAAPKRSIFALGSALVVVGLVTFVVGAAGEHPELAWQAYLINFLLWSAAAQGAVLFSAVTHITKARWNGPLAGLSGAFTGFFPVSIGLFLILFLGKTHVFPWIHEDLHGKEVWLNIPFLFTRDMVGLLILYGIGYAFLGCALKLRLDPTRPNAGLRRFIGGAAPRDDSETERIKSRMSRWAGLYIFAFALVLSLIGFDLVMSMDPHWVSTLFGAYHFIKTFYIGLGTLIILAAIVYLRQGKSSALAPSHFHDIGKLFFAFCLMWADFFYVQLVVIWYGNLPEETHYVILRTVLTPWRPLAWTVFVMCFILPFIILLNKNLKTNPRFMLGLCGMVIVGMWLEHMLLLGPALSHGATEVPLGVSDGLMFAGFLGMMMLAVAFTLKIFPELIPGSRDAAQAGSR